MKTRKQILMLLLVMLAGIPTLSAQTKKEKKEQKKEAVRQLIVSEDYKIDVNSYAHARTFYTSDFTILTANQK